MKKISLLAIATLALSLSACSGGKKVSSEQVIQGITNSMCKKMVSCQTGGAALSEDLCKETMKNALASHQDLPKLETTQKKLDSCVASIEKTDCSGLTGATPPKDCDFLK